MTDSKCVFLALMLLMICSLSVADKKVSGLSENENEMAIETCHDKPGGGLEDDMKCIDSEIDPSLDKRDLDKCRCPQNHLCHASKPTIQVIPVGQTEPKNPFVYKCVRDHTNDKDAQEYGMGLLMEDNKPDEVAVVKTEVITYVDEVEDGVNKEAEEAEST